MLRVVLMMNDGSLLTIKHQQYQTRILLKIEIKGSVFKVFVKKTEGTYYSKLSSELATDFKH